MEHEDSWASFGGGDADSQDRQCCAGIDGQHCLPHLLLGLLIKVLVLDSPLAFASRLEPALCEIVFISNILLLCILEDLGLSTPGTNDLPLFHPGVIAFAPPVAELGALMSCTVLVPSNEFFGLACIGATAAGTISKEALTCEHAAINIPNVLILILGA
jgi:hypothetical protein